MLKIIVTNSSVVMKTHSSPKVTHSSPKVTHCSPKVIFFLQTSKFEAPVPVVMQLYDMIDLYHHHLYTELDLHFENITIPRFYKH